MKLVLLILFGFTFYSLAAQKADTNIDSSSNTVVEGKVDVARDANLDKLVKYHIIVNEESGTIPGFRVQIISSAARADVLKTKSMCLQKFPALDVHMVYQQPYFKLRIGDFQTRNEAYKVLLKIRKDFTDAFIVRDGIDINNL